MLALALALCVQLPSDGVDPCVDQPLAAAPDPALARAYLEVGEAERASGHARTAATAFSQALALDPTLAPARSGRDASCAELHKDADATACAEAEASFSAGVVRYRAGDDPAALRLFEKAAAVSALRPPAGLYRALLAVRADDWPEARRQLDQAAVDPGLAEGVTALRRVAARQGRLVLSAETELGYDDNAELLPDTPPTGSTRSRRGDDRYTLAGGAVVRPIRALDLRLAQGVSFRDQLEVDALDLLTSSTEAGLRLPVTSRLRMRADAGLDYLVLGGQSYLVAPRAGALGLFELGDSTWLQASYRLRWRDYRAPAFAGFSGVAHEATAGAGVRTSWLRLEGAYVFAAEGARDALWADKAHGTTLDATLRPLGWLGLGLHGGYRHRAFDGIDPNVGFRRSDDEVGVELRLEADVSDLVTCYVGGALLRNASTVVDFEFTRSSASAGCSLVVGLL